MVLSARQKGQWDAEQSHTTTVVSLKWAKPLGEEWVSSGAPKTAIPRDVAPHLHQLGFPQGDVAYCSQELKAAFMWT